MCLLYQAIQATQGLALGWGPLFWDEGEREGCM